MEVLKVQDQILHRKEALNPKDLTPSVEDGKPTSDPKAFPPPEP